MEISLVIKRGSLPGGCGGGPVRAGYKDGDGLRSGVVEAPEVAPIGRPTLLA